MKSLIIGFKMNSFVTGCFPKNLFCIDMLQPMLPLAPV